VLIIAICAGFTPIHTGWTFYTPLSILYELFVGFDFVLGVVILVSFLTCSISLCLITNIKTGIDKKRPVISTISVGSWMVIVLFPVLIVINIMLILDRVVGSSFFSEPAGDSIVFQTGFWIFGHPEVYLLTLPVLGVLVSVPVVSPAAISTSSIKRSLVGILVSRVAFLSTVVWGHHMLSTNMDVFFKIFFILASAYIAIPMFNSIRFAVASNAYTSVKSFGVSNSLHQFANQSVYMAFLVPICTAGFILGGITTVFFFFSSSASSVHGSRFVVGHFHLFFVVFVAPLLIFIRL
jgi:heme/copper-type cytochrome/quinol oxidase subunit 1